MNTKTAPTTLWQDLGSLPGQYWLLFSGTFVNRFGHFVVPFLAIYLKQRGFGAGHRERPMFAGQFAAVGTQAAPRRADIHRD